MTAYAAGDAAAFEQLYARHQAALYSCGACSGRRWRRRPTKCSKTHGCGRPCPRALAAPGRGFRTWLFTLAHNRVIDLAAHRPRSVDRCVDGRRDARGSPTAAWKHWPAPGGSRAAERGARVLAACRRAPAAMPGGAAAAATQRLPVAPRRRPGAGRSARASKSASRPPDPAALCDVQAARVHGRIPGSAREGRPDQRPAGQTPSATPGSAKRCGSAGRGGRAAARGTRNDPSRSAGEGAWGRARRRRRPTWAGGSRRCSAWLGTAAVAAAAAS